MRPAPNGPSYALTRQESRARGKQIRDLPRERPAIAKQHDMVAGSQGARCVTSPSVRPCFAAGIFDVDGVLLAASHERAWREALTDFAPGARLTCALYQTHVAGRPRLDGARAALEAVGVLNADSQAELYANRKQARLEALITAGCVFAYPDALRFLRAIMFLGWPVAAASLSKNANPMMQLVHYGVDHMLLEVFDANVCGRDIARGKPKPDIFLLAAYELGVWPDQCFVVEDAPAGIEAARAAGMLAVGVARHNDAAGLWAAGAELVVSSLDEIEVSQLARGTLCRR